MLCRMLYLYAEPFDNLPFCSMIVMQGPDTVP